MLWIGLTGGLGSGKTTVSNRLRSMGYEVIDADQIAHQLLNPGQESYQEVITYFGPDLLNSDQTINRSLLGQRVFTHSKDLEKLESILHPRIQKEVSDLKQKLSRSHKIAFYDVPLLFEKKLEKNFDKIIVINCPMSLRVQRLKDRTTWSDREINQRIAAQIPLEEKVRKTPYVIQNDGDLSKLEQEIIKVLSLVLSHSK